MTTPGRMGATMQSEIIRPSVHLLESMRSIGYTLEAAVADLIDNSISAEASRIDIDADVVAARHLALLDDGEGMTAESAREALRFAGAVRERHASDLGRFGLGLKTASLSQARRLTLVTKHQSQITALRWDVDYVREKGDWVLIVLDPADLGDLPLIEKLMKRQSGTLVVWNELDLLLGDAKEPGPYLAERLGGLRTSLSLVFHRFLEGRQRRLTITVNGLEIQPLDPFVAKNPKTQRTLVETVDVAGVGVQVEGFTLPHTSGLDADERRRPDLGEGMRGAQGFYVYRNQRLISYGHWYGLAKMSELTKQTRVKVDVPPELDNLWQLDIKKSRSEPPSSFKSRLKQLIDPLVDSGRRVHTFRGRRDLAPITHVWMKVKTRDGFRYEVDLSNPLVSSMLAGFSTPDSQRVLDLVHLLTTTYPILDAYVELAANVPVLEYESDSHLIISRLEAARDSALFDQDPETAYSQLVGVEPFDSTDDLRALIELVWEGQDVSE